MECKKYNCQKKHRMSLCVCMGIVLVWMTVLLAGCGADREAVAETQDDPGIVSPETALPETDISVDESEEETTEPDAVETESDAEASVEEDAAQYDCEPISYDLTKLPAMENKMYAEWEGKIYYRQYSDEDMEEGALWAEFAPTADTEKELMCMEPDGSVTQVGVDDGYGALFIVNERIYSQKYTNTGSIVYSCALDGSDVIEYAFSKGGIYSGEVYDVKDGKVICRTSGKGGLAYVDAQTGQEHILVDTDVDYLDAAEEEVFYYDYQKNDETDENDLTLYSVDYMGNISPLKTITREEYLEYAEEDLCQYPIDIPYFEILGDELYFAAGSYNGNAYMYSGGPIYSMKKDGSGCRVEAFSYDYSFYLYDDGENRALYFESFEEENGIAVGDEAMRRISLVGEPPENVIPWRSLYGSYDKPRVYLGQNLTDSILFYPDTSGVCYVLLTPEESEELGIRTHVDGHYVQQIEDIEYLNGKLFFTVTDLVYSEEYSIGWRDGYMRGRTACYCKDLESGEICLLYEYGK